MKQFILIICIGVTVQLIAQNSTVNRLKHYNLEKGLAIQGYDPVAYFIAGKAVKGNKLISAHVQGAIYYFSTETNKKIFLTNPVKYEPQYGGWCAYAMGDYGKKVEVDPETFKILDGKLYLFYNAYLNNTLTSWNKDEKNLKIKADANWLKLTSN
ncbi:MAG: YHS domain protein [Bacteroidia bacterium]|jgi:YHS domain-containing protein|nr:YHS domain protein [Bacteroidia bacterium]